MTASNQGQPKQLLLITLVLLLFVIVCVQAWHMVRMEKQLDAINDLQSSVQLPIEDATTQTEVLAESTVIENSTNNQPSLLQDNQGAEQPHDDDFLNSPFYTPSWVPYEEIRRMQRETDRAFNDRYNRINKHPDYQHSYRQHIEVPKINVRENNNQYTVFVNIPDTDEDNISVNLEGQRLTIKARQGYEKKDRDEAGRFIFRERRSGSFQRSVILPKPVDPRGMRSRTDNGVLTIMIPKQRY